MQAITTKYLGPSNSRGARVKARAERGAVTIPWNHAVNVAENHRLAAIAALLKWEWSGRWIGGALPDSTGYAFTCDPKASHKGAPIVEEL